MFDVIWTDPDRKLVGEHRAAKEKKREQKEKQKALEGRSSLSTRSSRSSIESPFQFLRSRGPKHATPSKGKTSSSSGLASPSILSSRSPLSIDSDRSNYRHSVAILDNSDNFSEPTCAKDRLPRKDSSLDSECDQPSGISDRDTYNQSQEHNRNENVESSDRIEAAVDSGGSVPKLEKVSRVVQTLGPSSFITKRTEVTWMPRNGKQEDVGISTEVVITSGSSKEREQTPSVSPNSRSHFIITDCPVDLTPSLKSATLPTSPMSLMSFKPNNPDAWRPPDEWDCPTPDPKSATLHSTSSTDGTLPDILQERLSEDCPDLSILQREVRRMAKATPDVVLSRLKEVWTTSDPSLRQELEMEKKRWMLSSLHHLDPIPDQEPCRPATAGSLSGEPTKILALYESKATASYLAALHLKKQVYHVSATPLSHALFPNIHPVLVPSTSPSAFPLAPQIFKTVYSLSLPAICSSSDIPKVLKNVHKCLKPGGSLQLTLIDPLPCAGTLGYRLRRWIEENLLLNLERKFRCMNPSRVFPHWLGDACLRGPGSTLTTAKFYAMPASARSHEADPDRDPFIDHAQTEKETKAELRSLVGRMLWMEVWGSYVTGGRWWWEDEACVEECLQLGTFWEYSVIEGIRDG